MFAASTLTFVLLAFAEPVETRPAFQAPSYIAKKVYLAECTEEMVRSAPQWEENADSPPLSPRKAVRLATKMKDSFVDNHDDFQLTSLTLQSVGGRWVWMVSFTAPPKEPFRPQMLSVIQLIVLMDGKVPKPVEVDVTESAGYGSGETNYEPGEAPKKSPISK